MKDDTVDPALVLGLDLVAELGCKYAKLKQALDSIAHYVAENPELALDYPVLKRALEDAGYDVNGPGEPEPFIHGDSDSGAEG